MKILSILLILLFLSGCFGGTFYSGLMSECKRIVASGTRKNGILKRIHKDGWLFSEGKIQNGRLEGWWTYYRKDGSIYNKKLFKDGEWNGYLIVFYENGQIACEGVSDIINPSSKVKPKYFDPDSNLIREEEYYRKYDKLVGKWLDELWEKKHGKRIFRRKNK